MSGDSRHPGLVRSRRGVLLLCVAVFGLASCKDGTEGRLPVFPVTGSVLQKELPAPGAIVTFHPLDPAVPATIRPNAQVEVDGTFRLTTYESGDGAPAGEYAVTVFWPEPPQSPVDAPDSGPDRLQGRFADPERSSLRVSVPEAATEFEPFRID